MEVRRGCRTKSRWSRGGSAVGVDEMEVASGVDRRGRNGGTKASGACLALLEVGEQRGPSGEDGLRVGVGWKMWRVEVAGRGSIKEGEPTEGGGRLPTLAARPGEGKGLLG